MTGASPDHRYHAEPGGGAVQVLPGPGPEVVKVAVGPMDNNAYLVTVGSVTVLVDAAADAPRLLEVLGPRSVTALVTTHRHADHLGALPELARATGARLFCGAEDLAAVEEATGTRQHPLRHGDTVPLPGLGEDTAGLGVVGLVGHTPGSIALVLPGWTDPAGRPGPTHLFTGDSLFPGGPGRTADARDFTALMDDLEARVFDVFPDPTVVHPGHGDATTLGTERPHLARWRARGW